MPCYTPLSAYRTRDDKLEYNITFNPENPNIIYPQQLPCGQCIGCRLTRSRNWAVRCMHEAQMNEKNCFLTITYNEENLPEGGTLNHEHFQLFMKRLRKKFPSSIYGKIRYYMCGEYGENLGRPHYHACIFNFDFTDKIHWRTTKAGNKLYTSETLNKLWQGKGYCIIGDVTFESAAYVARYITKKMTGPKADEYYSGRKPEYNISSNGIGKSWIEKYHKDVYPHDEMIMRGKKFKPARYYDKYYEKKFPNEFLDIKQDREESAFLQYENPENSPERRLVKYEVKVLTAKQLTRNYEFTDDVDKSNMRLDNRDTRTIKYLKETRKSENEKESVYCL